MLYCNRCRKEVILFGISHFKGAEKIAGDARQAAEREGRLIIFNPPPFTPQRCPACSGELTEK